MEANDIRTPKEQMRYDVLNSGKTLRQCKKENFDLYAADKEELQKLRLAYLTSLPAPKSRKNYYIDGHHGLGYSLVCAVLARDLYQHRNDEDIFFSTRRKEGEALLGYDGQPIIIWGKRTAHEWQAELKGQENVLAAFEPHPAEGKAPYLCNCINFVYSPQSRDVFLDEMFGEDKKRLKFKVFDEEALTAYLNKGHFD